MEKSLNENSYDAIAEEWDRIRSSHPVDPCIQKCAELVKKGGHILDIGCGSGKLIDSYLIQAGFQVTGIDLSEKMADLAKKNVPAMEVHHADFLNWKTEEKYDALIGFDSLFHIDEPRQAEIYPKAAELLKPGGYFLFTAGNKRSSVTGEMLDREFSYGALDQEKVKRLLETNGFEIIRFILNYEDPVTGTRDLIVYARKEKV